MSAIPGKMRAIEISGAGTPDVLKLTHRPVPSLQPKELLIEVHAAGINRPDVLQRQGKYQPPPGTTDIPGLEVAGRVAAVSGDVGRWAVGDAVCGLVTGGGYAEYCAARAVQCLPVPKGYSMEWAAAIPETFFTVWSNVFDRGKLQPREVFLVHGGSSGIGTAAIQMARAFDARVFTTAGSAAKCAACEELGAERAIHYPTEDFVAIIKELTGGHGADVILDMVGGDTITRNIECLAMDGRHISIAALQGNPQTLSIMSIMAKRLTLTGSLLRPRSTVEKSRIAKHLLDKVWPKLESGEIKPVIYRTFPLDAAAQAHRLMESSEHIGKIVLQVR